MNESMTRRVSICEPAEFESERRSPEQSAVRDSGDSSSLGLSEDFARIEGFVKARGIIQGNEARPDVCRPVDFGVAGELEHGAKSEVRNVPGLHF